MKKTGHKIYMIQNNIAALIVAAGRGQRAGGGIPKQYRSILGERVLTYCMRALLIEPTIRTLICVIHPDDQDLYQSSISALSDAEQKKIMHPVFGGNTRQQSVYAGLKALANNSYPQPQVVLVHDGARPFVTPALIRRGLESAISHPACVPAIPLTDTLKQIDNHNKVVGTPDRASLMAVQTPQIFNFNLLYQAHQNAIMIDGMTDDAMVVERMGHAVHIFDGDAGNIKLTTESDFIHAERAMTPSMLTLTGFGYDVHAFASGDHVMLAGVKIPYEKGVRAHSDGDVILHALCDALFGVMGDGDIGQHFPPSDPQWKGASSDRFLHFALDRLHKRGGRLLHIDVTLLAEAPRIGPHRSAMITSLSQLLSLPASRIGLKATTSESMGFAGRKEGLAASVVVSVNLPEKESSDV